MSFQELANWLNRRLYRRKHRAILKKWYADGGDHRFRFDYPLDRQSLVLDLGGYEGQWANDLYSRYKCRIMVFEPVRSFADNICARFRNNRDIEVLQYGLGATSRTETIRVCGASSSTYKHRGTPEEIRIVDAAKWFNDRRIQSVQLMKINIEGGEFELLERLIETGLVATVDHVQVQFHNFSVGARRRMESIQAGLRLTHTPTYQYEFVWENWVRGTDSAG